MKYANGASIDSVLVRLKTVFSEAISGSTIEVMKPHAKNSVVTAMKGTTRLFFSFVID